VARHLQADNGVEVLPNLLLLLRATVVRDMVVRDTAKDLLQDNTAADTNRDLPRESPQTGAHILARVLTTKQ
jgi:hypothetical protein